MKEYINLEINQQLRKCFKKYGVEGTEQKICELYSLMPKIKEMFLTEYHRIISAKK